MDDTDAIGRLVAIVRQMSKALLGAQFRGEIAAYIALAEGPYWARSISAALGIPENKVSAELARFAELRLLAPMTEAATWDRRRLFVKGLALPSYLAMATDMVKLAATEAASGSDAEAERLMDLYLDRVHGDHAATLNRAS